MNKYNNKTLQRYFSIFRKITPEFVSNFVRVWVTALVTPIRFSLKSGHFRSSLTKKAVNAKGEPIPWYTYSCNNFLLNRYFMDKKILEFGGGQSSIWWGKNSKSVVTFEGDKNWFNTIKKQMPSNVDLQLVSLETPEACLADIESYLQDKGVAKYDVIVIDGLYREVMPKVALKYMEERGCIIFDNTDDDGYDSYSNFSVTNLQRVDFYGLSPGVSLVGCTSIYFSNDCFLFSNKIHVASVD
jgi:hypothetical protein